MFDQVFDDCLLNNDRQLISHIRDTEEEAFSAVYNRYHKSVYAYVLSLVKIPEIAEDLVQEVFMKLWLIRKKLTILSSFESYMFRIAHNMAVDFIKRAAVDRELRNKILIHIKFVSQPQESSSEYIKKHDALLDEALASLPPQRRKVFDLCRQGQKSYKEVGQVLGISRNTVKEHMVKAMQSLRSFLREKGDIFMAVASLAVLL